jgi:hypothetical protein
LVPGDKMGLHQGIRVGKKVENILEINRWMERNPPNHTCIYIPPVTHRLPVEN